MAVSARWQSGPGFQMRNLRRGPEAQFVLRRLRSYLRCSPDLTVLAELILVEVIL